MRTESRKLKVVFIADIGSAYRTGGGQTFARLFLEGVVQHWKGVELKVFLYQKPVDQGIVISQIPEEIVSKINLTLITTPDYSIGHPLTDLSVIAKFRNRIKAINADLYLFDQPNALLMSLPLKPSIAIFHGSICSFVNYKPNLFQFRRLIKKALWQRVFVKSLMLRYLRNEKNYLPLFNSFYSLNESLRCVPGLNKKFLETLVIGLPVDARMFFCSDELGHKYRKNYGIQKDDIVLTYISNFAQKKLPNIVPEIISHLLENKKIHFFFVGRSMDSNELDQFCEQHDNCYRIIEVPQYEVNGYINMSNILFSTSKTETFGYTIKVSPNRWTENR